MSKIIEEYYAKTQLPTPLLKSKLNKLEKHPDIKEEFEYWILNNTYKTDSCIEIEGYTAATLARLSNFIDGEGSFMLLVELRDNPDKALSRIKSGFKLK